MDFSEYLRVIGFDPVDFGISKPSSEPRPTPAAEAAPDFNEIEAYKVGDLVMCVNSDAQWLQSQPAVITGAFYTVKEVLDTVLTLEGIDGFYAPYRFAVVRRNDVNTSSVPDGFADPRVISEIDHLEDALDNLAIDYDQLSDKLEATTNELVAARVVIASLIDLANKLTSTLQTVSDYTR